MAGDDQALDQDRAIELPGQDVLERGPFVESLIRALVTDIRDDADKLKGRRSNGYVVGLTGPWGSGKSSVLNLIAEKLGSMSNVIVVTFNPWLFSGRDELLRGFFNELRTAMGQSKEEAARELLTLLDRYWGAINLAGHAVAAVADLHGASGAATVWWSRRSKDIKGAINRPAERSPEQERKSLEAKLKEANIAVVVLIDELDRVEDAEVRAVAQLVKAVGDIKGVSYLVAYDAERVTEALGRGEGGDRKRSGMRYIEKIIQYPVPLRPLFDEDVEAIFQALLSHHKVTLGDTESDNERELLTLLKSRMSTPRDVKRLIGAYIIIAKAVRQEISAIDVLAYSWLITKAPIVRDAIAQQFDKVVDDPAEQEMVRRFTARSDESKEPPNPAEVLNIAVSAEDRELLQLLFPRFRQERSRDQSGMRLSKRRNLVRILYLGDPPGLVSRTEVERIWASPDTVQMEAVLREQQASGKIASLFDRMDDVLAKLPATQDSIFWCSVSRVLTRPTDWVSGAEPGYARIDDAATMLMRLGLRDAEQIPRVKAVIEALIHDELLPVSWTPG